MYIVRDIFYLKFGHFRNAKDLLDQALKSNLMPKAQHMRVLSDFTGDAYRLIFEEGHSTLADYERTLGESMRTEEWQKWYVDFKQHIDSAHREILKLVE
ncbi:hypothetical protein [Pontibacter vulgaris]|uniref:hypothetical protein n=1 Tax=Pontibacter vulgaris TaxID=2905679 RepID=UPI001FA80578|nr:hypothetical protein [Pontibacter vulgaris]